MSSYKADCRKFQPNIFNKTKCSNCFRQREEHSAEALESNRASRKVSKCGYLFVAPDWDFSIPLYRTKRWQRRWFVLYDDGEFTYSVDDLPATIPQGVIDMNRVLEVSEAEDVTGNQYSLAITAPDRVTFIKGTCREESRWWFDVLAVFPTAQKGHGRHKRNATFPGIKPTSALQQSRNGRANTPSPSLGSRYESSVNQRMRFHSCTTESLVSRPSSAPTLDTEEDVFPTKDPSSSATSNSASSVNTPYTPSGTPPSPLYHSTPLSSLPPSTRLLRDEHKENTPPYNEDYVDNPPTSESPPTQDKLSHLRRSRRTAKRESRSHTTPRSNEVPRQQQILLSDLEECKREEKLKDIADSITRLRGNSSISYLNNENGGDKPTREKDNSDVSPVDNNKVISLDVIDSTNSEQVRGAPDGLEGSLSYSSNVDLQRVDLPAEDLLYIKKGWLMRQGVNQELNKYWFVLHGTGLRFYRDPSAEDNGILDGIIDLSMVKSIEECEASRNYGFMIVTWEDKKYTFSAVTSGIRGNWVHALRNAANLRDIKDRPLTLGEKIEREIVAKRERTSSQSTYESLPAEKDQSMDLNDSTVSNLSRIISSEDDFQTASETSTNLNNNSQDDFFQWDRGRARAELKQSKRSRSSPPSSRRNTREDFPNLSSRESPSLSEDGSIKSLSDILEKHSAKDSSSSTLNGTGETVLVDLLETQVESLKAKLEQTQGDYLELHKENAQLKNRLGSIVSVDSNISNSSNDSTNRLTNRRQNSRLDNSPNYSVQNMSSTKQNQNLTYRYNNDVMLRAPNKKLHDLENSNEQLSKEVQKLRGDKESLNLDRRDLKRRVSSLEIQVSDLLKRIEQQDKEISDKTKQIESLNQNKQRLNDENNDWESKYLAEELKSKNNAVVYAQRETVIRKLSRSLKETENQVASLTLELENKKKKSSSLESKSGNNNSDVLLLVAKIERLTEESNKLKETVKCEKSEVYKWKDLVKELRSLLDGRNEEIDRRGDEVEELKENLKSTQLELDHTADRLKEGIEENESLYSRVKELERQLQVHEKNRRASSNLSISSSKERFSSRRSIPRLDSLSDLTNIDLNIEPENLEKEHLVDEYNEIRTRFEKAVSEIRALKREVREAQNVQDELEIAHLKTKQDSKSQSEDFKSQMNLMTSRVQDLTTKLNNSEKQVRMLKQKVTRAETKDRRRTQSLKGRESFTLSRDMENKLAQLESKIDKLNIHETNGGLPNVAEEGSKEAADQKLSKFAKRSRSFEDSTKSSRLRRKSLDSPSGSEAVKAIVRINNLEAKVASLSGEEVKSPISSSSTSISTSLSSPVRSKSPTVPTSPHRSPLRSPSMPRKSTKISSRTTDKLNKVSRSDSDSKHLKDKVTSLEKVLTELHSKLSECVTWVGSVECVCSCGSPYLTSLQQNLNAALRVSQLRSSSIDQTVVSKLRPLSNQIQDLLSDKLNQLAQRRYQLKSAGKWTRDAQLKCFAERLAFESMIASQVAQTIQAAHKPDGYESCLKLQDLVETHRKLSFLEKKLTNPEFDMDTMTPLDFYTSLLTEKLVVQGDVYDTLVNSSTFSSKTVPLNNTSKDLQSKLLEREQNLACLVTQYKNEKLHEIAVVMARETVTGQQPLCDESVLLEEVRMREAWVIAQDIVTQELLNLEVSQSILRLSNLFNQSSKDNAISSYTTVMGLDRLHSAAEESLRQEMEESVMILSNKYEGVLAQYRSGDTEIIHTVKADIEQVIGEFASVVAQKATIDGHLAVVQGETETPSAEPLTIVEETKDSAGLSGDVVASEAHLLMFLGGNDATLESYIQPALTQAEFIFLYNKASAECNKEIMDLLQNLSTSPDTSLLQSLRAASSTSLINQKDLESGSQQSLIGGSKVLPSPKTKRKIERKSRRASDITGMIDTCRNCEELKQEICKLRRSLDLRRNREKDSECKKCIDYINRIKEIDEDHKSSIQSLNVLHSEEITRLKDQVKYEPPTRDSDDELTELKRRLCLLEEGYEAQIAALKKQYEKSRSGQSEPLDDNVRQRYQLEVEQLRGLCEKGLGALENSNKRMLAELEEKHRREMAALQAEKEQALAEETQATLAALDAMRKAHEAEVQREITKFKEEFLKKMQSGQDIEVLHKEHEAEIQDVRREILSLSEKYSKKCLESSSLEDKVDTLSRHLSETTKQIFDLEARNKQLRTHLSAHIAQLQRESNKDSSSHLRLQESELILRNEEIARLTQQLQVTQSHEADMVQLCSQLGTFLKSDRNLRTNEVSALRDKLEHIILTAANMQEPDEIGITGRQNQEKSSIRRSSCVALPSAVDSELSRSPSCPRLTNFSAFLLNGPSPGVAAGGNSNLTLPQQSLNYQSPLAGMVASRKKVFETVKPQLTMDNL